MFLEACYMAGDSALVQKVTNSVKTDLMQQMRFYNSLSGTNADNMGEEKRMAENYLRTIEQMQTAYNPRIQVPGKLMQPADSGKKAKK